MINYYKKRHFKMFLLKGAIINWEQGVSLQPLLNNDTLSHSCNFNVLGSDRIVEPFQNRDKT